MHLVRLPGQKLSQHRSSRDGGEEVALPADPGFTGGVKTLPRVVQGCFHEKVQGDRPLRPDQASEGLGQEGVQTFGILFIRLRGGEIDDSPPQIKLRG